MRVACWNIGALVAALALASAVLWAPGIRSRIVPIAPDPAHPRASESSPLIDHGGHTIPPRAYRRIVSLSTVADELLLELCEPDRVVAFTAYSARKVATGYRFAGKPALEGAKDLEAILALHPDLVIANHLGDPRPLARMRDAGLVVYDLGEMRGMTALVTNVHEVAAIVGHPERGDRFAGQLLTRMSAVAEDIPPSSRKRGLYLSVYGGHLYGGAGGTSYDDVLRAAGLIDAAAAYRDWPEYSSEQILALDPDVLVTNHGMERRICEHTGLESLRACATPHRVVALDDDLLGDPGPAILDAAEAVRAGVYGPAPFDRGAKEQGP